MKSIRLASAALASLTVVALSGCALAVVVDGGSGIGTCEGKGDVSIATTQTALGDSFTIDYYGPEDVSLGVVQGFYSENNFYDLTPTRLTGFGGDIEDPSVNLSVIVDEEGWTTTPTVDGVHASYEGTIVDFMSTLDAVVGSELGGGDPTIDTVLPFAVGVSCDETLTSGVYAEEFIGDPDYEMGGFPVATDFSFAAAQPVFPNHVATGPLRILTQSDILIDVSTVVGTEGTLRLPEGIVAQLGDFTLEPVVDPEFDEPISIEMVMDSAEIPNNNMSDLWFQLVAGSDFGNSFYFELEQPYSLTDTMAFSVYDEGTGGIIEGDYLVFIALEGLNADEEPIGKLLFGSATYSETDGLELTSIDVPLSGDVDETAAELSETGVDASAIGIGAGALLAGGVALGAVAAVRRARSKK
jgi:hypothetical protein